MHKPGQKQCTDAPCERTAKTDITVQVTEVVGVIPVFDVEDLFHGPSGKVLK